MTNDERMQLLCEAQVFLQRMKAGELVIACVGALNARKTLTMEQVVSMVQTYSPIVGLLQTGSLESAQYQVNAIVPDGVVILQSDKDAILEIIAEKILRYS